jgi:hypothetical protein
LALLDIRRAIPYIGQTAAMKPLLLALLFGLNLLGTPAMATEEPPFTVKSTQGEFEIRDYPALVAAEVTVTGDRKQASSKGFRLWHTSQPFCESDACQIDLKRLNPFTGPFLQGLSLVGPHHDFRTRAIRFMM